MKKLHLLTFALLAAIAASAQHQQAKLNYRFGDLEPYIDSTTMRIHYSAHHAAYAKNLNKALEGYPDLQAMPLMMLLRNITALPAPIQTAVRNNCGGVYNHNLFFEGLTSPANSQMPEAFRVIIEKQFGSVDKLEQEMTKASQSRFGSGWAWLMAQPDGKLTIVTTPNQDAPFMDVSLSEGSPIFNIDVWEHAYYLKYQNRRPEYLQNIWKVVNWDQVYQNYLKAVGQ